MLGAVIKKDEGGRWETGNQFEVAIVVQVWSDYTCYVHTIIARKPRSVRMKKRSDLRTVFRP